LVGRFAGKGTQGNRHRAQWPVRCFGGPLLSLSHSLDCIESIALSLQLAKRVSSNNAPSYESSSSSSSIHTYKIDDVSIDLSMETHQRVCVCLCYDFFLGGARRAIGMGRETRDDRGEFLFRPLLDDISQAFSWKPRKLRRLPVTV
jgi:hypothetical protein